MLFLTSCQSGPEVLMIPVITPTTGTVTAETVPTPPADNYPKSTAVQMNHPMKTSGVKQKTLRVGFSLLTNR